MAAKQTPELPIKLEQAQTSSGKLKQAQTSSDKLRQAQSELKKKTDKTPNQS
jgi:hypothetical protein